MIFDYSIRAKFYGGVSHKREGIAVHYTGDEERCGTAKDTAEMFADPERQASAHIVVDEGDTAYVCVPLDRIAFAVGGLLYKDSQGGRYYEQYGNVNTISIEMVSRTDANGRWYIPEKTIQNAIEVIKILQAMYGIDDDHVFRHYDINGKPCPWCWTNEPPYNGEYLWREFKDRLKVASSKGGEKTMKFIDISHWNGTIDFEAVKNEVDGVIMKCSQGSYRDDRFEEYYAKATAAGLKVGCYVFMAATSPAEAKSEANFALSCLMDKKMPLGIWLDVETDNIRTTSFVENCITELSIFKACGFDVGIYANLNWYRNYLTNDLKLYPLWIARYGANNGQPNPESKPEIDMYMWQYTSKGKINGISGNVDISEVYKVFDKSEPDIFDGLPEDPEPIDSAFEPHVKYKAYVKDKGWMPEVLDETDYAGIRGVAITAFAVMVTEGSVKYRCHIKGGGWYPYVTGYSAADFNNGYAGDKASEIDAIEVYYYTPSGKPIKRAKYRVSPVGGNYYSAQYDNEKTNGQDGYAGLFGKSIDRITIKLVD